MPTHDLNQNIRDVVEPTLERMGLDLVAVEVLGGRRGSILRLSIDKPGGVSAGDCAQASIQLSPVLDADEPIKGAYLLEVSSPGIDRPVQRWDDFRRFVGFTIRIRMEEGLPRRRFVGILESAEDGDLGLRVDGALHLLSFDAVERAQLVLELEEYARLGESLPPVPESVLAPADTVDGDPGGTR